jgi:hypothetical protein
MKKTLLFAMMLLSIISVQAVVKVAYITFQKTMDASAVAVENDPIIQMLNADSKLQVTVKVLTAVAATDVISDLATYDVIIVQESFSGSAGMLMPAGALALKSIPKPFIYNKTYAFKSGRALTTSSAAGGKESNLSLTITVASTALTNDLFKACTIGSSNDISLFNALSSDAGLLGNATSSVKAINYSSGNVISGASTILASPTALNADGSTVSVCINDIPAGRTIDSETLLSRMIGLSMNFGAICGNGGKNITDNCLTIWRNAVYILGGLAVPSTKATLPTGVNTVNDNSEIISVDYYTLNGIHVTEPRNLATGVFVKRTGYQSGLVKSEKVVFVK